MAIADVFDALTSERPYKEAWTVEKAVNYLNEQTEIHFDPTLIDAFNRCLPDILAIKRKYLDD